MKYCPYSQQFADEIIIQNKLWKKSQETKIQELLKANKVAFPEMKACGLFTQEAPRETDEDVHMDICDEFPEPNTPSIDELQQFMIMPRLGQNLEQYFESLQYRLPEISIYSLAIKMITLLECVHKIGLVYNDLKLDNLMVEAEDRLPDATDIREHTDVFEKCTINLVDYGFATSMVDKETRQHVE